MCAPAAIGVAQAGIGIAGAAGQHSAKQAEYAHAKQQAEMQRRQAIVNANHRDAQDVDRWAGELEIWQAKKSQYAKQKHANRDAAGKAYAAASMQEEKMFRDFVANSANIQLKQLTAKSGGLGQRGKTATRLDNVASARAGEALANAKDMLLYGQDNIKEQKYQVVDDWEQANREQWRQVSIAPRPTMRSRSSTFLPGDPPKPSNVGLITGIGSSLLGGMKAYNSLMPPGQGLFGGGGTPGPNLQSIQIPGVSGASPLGFPLASNIIGNTGQ